MDKKTLFVEKRCKDIKKKWNCQKQFHFFVELFCSIFFSVVDIVTVGRCHGVFEVAQSWGQFFFD